MIGIHLLYVKIDQIFVEITQNGLKMLMEIFDTLEMGMVNDVFYLKFYEVIMLHNSLNDIIPWGTILCTEEATSYFCYC